MSELKEEALPFVGGRAPFVGAALGGGAAVELG
jgi:hypothetical protein